MRRGGKGPNRSIPRSSRRRPPVCDMELGNFTNWTELFATHMMNIDEQFVLMKFENADAALSSDAIDNIQDELKMTHAAKKAANHALNIRLLGDTSGKAKSRVMGNAIVVALELYQYSYNLVKSATTVNIVIMMAEVLPPARATRMEDIEEKLNEWKEKQRYLEDLVVPPMDFDQKKDVVDQHVAHERDGLRHQESDHDERHGGVVCVVRSSVDGALGALGFPGQKTKRKHQRSKGCRWNTSSDHGVRVLGAVVR